MLSVVVQSDGDSRNGSVVNCRSGSTGNRERALIERVCGTEDEVSSECEVSSATRGVVR